MIELTRRQVRTVRTTIRQALGITSAGRAPAVTFRSTPDGLLVQAVNDNIAIEYLIPGDRPPECLSVPYAALVACEARRDDAVTIRRLDDTVMLRWNDGGIPQESQHTACEPAEIPNSPASLSIIEPKFLSAMAEAVATTDNESTRYALSCIRLRGSDGQIAATDGRQALIQTGYEFPWDDDVLVPASRVFASKEFCSADEVAIGRSDDWVTIRSGSWTVHLKIEKEARFPAVEDQVPNVNSATTTLTFSDADAEFLTKAMKRLPGAKEYNAPITADLNGAVVLRVKSVEQSTLTELVLTNSQRDGDEIRFNSNREFLARAARLGFRQVHLRGPESPAFCTVDCRSYIWALLGKEGAFAPDANATRIESPAHSRNPHRKNRITIPMKQPTTQTTSRSDTNRPTNVLASAEALRDSLSQALTDTRELISAIKARRKQNRLVESTLRSLKQLENIGA